jgi:hypothetical protein
MKIARFCVLPLVGLVVCGCRTDGLKTYERYNLGEACQTVALSVEAMGGLSRWKGIGEIRTSALMTIYDDGGPAYVNRQQQRIDVHGDSIATRAETARGRWQATYSHGGSFSLSGAAALDQISPRKVRESLAIVLHRVRGPFNLIHKAEKPLLVKKVWANSQDMVRVGVTGGEEGVKAYYFDATDGLLRMVTAGTDSPGREGTVTLYTYQKLPDGIVFPSKIRVVRTGEHVLVGKTPVMEVEFSEVVVR